MDELGGGVQTQTDAVEALVAPRPQASPWQWPGVPRDKPALVADDGEQLSYGELADRADAFAARLGSTRSLLAIEAENCIDAMVAYLGALRGGHVVMLLPAGQQDHLDRVLAGYAPHWVYSRCGADWTLASHGTPRQGELHPELALLLSTSGSTGAVKFVRLSRENVAANAASIADYLGIQPEDRALTTLPFHYSYGLSVVNSHLLLGATVLVTQRSVVDRALWSFFDEQRGTSLAGVPYTYELLDSAGFDRLDLPHLRILTQAGGRLPREKVLRYATLARDRGWEFFVMYGQTEATARMAYLPPADVLDFPDCIGRAIPGGRFALVDEQGREITACDTEGELVYEGPNVMLGYALSRDDLAKGREIEKLATGDMATVNQRGLYRITGRRSRFLKLFGLRIGLDELESQLEREGLAAVCGGTDAALVVLTLQRGAAPAIARLLAERCKLPASVIDVREVGDYPLLPSGKVDYRAIAALAAQKGTGAAATPAKRLAERLRDAKKRWFPMSGGSIRAQYAAMFSGRAIADSDSFVSLGGDSLTFVEAAMGVEDVLGHLPDGWQEMSVAQLERIAPQRSAWRAVDSVSLLRFLAIVSVVSGHFRLFSAPGAAYFLLVVAGYNFARFQATQVLRVDAAGPIVRSMFRVALPTVVFVMLYQLQAGRYSVQQLLLLGNWLPPKSLGFGFWFLEVLVQVLVLMALAMSFRPVREAARRTPFGFGLGLLAAGIAAAAVVPLWWDSNHLYNRVPHMLLWMFALGYCVFHAPQGMKRLLVALLLVAVPCWFFGWTPLSGRAMPGALLWFWLGGLALLMLSEVKLPYPLNKLVYLVGGASMFIFITHGPLRLLLQKLGWSAGPLSEVVFALAGGVAIWWAWEQAARFLSLGKPVERAPAM